MNPEIETLIQPILDRGGTVDTLDGAGFPTYVVELDGAVHGPLIERELIAFVEGL